MASYVTRDTQAHSMARIAASQLGCVVIGVAFIVVGVLWLINAPDQLRGMVLPSEVDQVTPLAIVMFRYAAMWITCIGLLLCWLGTRDASYDIAAVCGILGVCMVCFDAGFMKLGLPLQRPLLLAVLPRGRHHRLRRRRGAPLFRRQRRATAACTRRPSGAREAQGAP